MRCEAKRQDRTRRRLPFPLALGPYNTPALLRSLTLPALLTARVFLPGNQSEAGRVVVPGAAFPGVLVVGV